MSNYPEYPKFNIQDHQGVSHTPTSTPTPTPTPTLMVHHTYGLLFHFTSNHQADILASPQQDWTSTGTTIPYFNMHRLADVDYIPENPDNMTVIGIRDSSPLKTYDVTHHHHFLVDKKPTLTNSGYLNQHPNACIGTDFAYGYTLIPQFFIPKQSSVKNSNREIYGRRLKANMSHGLTSGPVAQFSDLVDPYLFCPRLKTGLTILDTTAGSPDTNPIAADQEKSAIVENYIFGGDYNSNTESVVSSAYYGDAGILFLAIVDDNKNGRIAMFDAKTTNLVFLGNLDKFLSTTDEETGNISSDIDIAFDLLFKYNQYNVKLSDPRLFVNVVGTSGKKAVRIYDLSSLDNVALPPPSPTSTPTPTVTPTVTPTIPVTPSNTPTIPVTPSNTPTNTLTPTPTPTVGFAQYRYTRKSLVLDNLVPCSKYRLTLWVDSPQIGKVEVQILDFNDLNRNQFDNTITFEAQNVQKYFRLDDTSKYIAHDDKSYQTIHYSIYHDTNIDTAVIRYRLENLTTGKVTNESRIISCDDRIPCDTERVECVDQIITQLIQNPDGTFDIYVVLDPNSGFFSQQELLDYINKNKCCHLQYSINNEEWIDLGNNNIIACEALTNS